MKKLFAIILILSTVLILLVPVRVSAVTPTFKPPNVAPPDVSGN